VLDGFLGSGSTLIACERVGRVCRGVELDPVYVDVAIRGWQRHTGDQGGTTAQSNRHRLTSDASNRAARNRHPIPNFFV
jgi:hypothetical protein